MPALFRLGICFCHSISSLRKSVDGILEQILTRYTLHCEIECIKEHVGQQFQNQSSGCLCEVNFKHHKS